MLLVKYLLCTEKKTAQHIRRCIKLSSHGCLLSQKKLVSKLFKPTSFREIGNFLLDIVPEHIFHKLHERDASRLS